MYFYELHENDDELFTDVLLAHDVEYDEDELLELVLEARSEVVGGFEEDSLVEAVANELQRRHGFIHIDDRQLRVAIAVSAYEGETRIAPVDTGRMVEDAPVDGDGDFRSLLVEVDPEDPR